MRFITRVSKHKKMIMVYKYIIEYSMTNYYEPIREYLVNLNHYFDVLWSIDGIPETEESR